MLRLALRFLTAAPVVLAAALMGAPAHADIPAIGITETGLLKGSFTDSTVVFKGIPYAKPPVGDLRWQPPQRAQRWKGFRDATAFAPHCAQLDTPFGTASNSEDCLYLNVYAPKRNVHN